MRRSDRALRLRASRGFTFIWVLLVVAVMGAGLAGAAQIEATLVRRDKERELLRVGNAFRGAIASYYETRQGSGRREYPATLDDLLRDPRSPGMVRHLRQIYVDPMTGQREWALVRVAGRIVGVHSTSKAEPLKQSGFEPDDMGFAEKGEISQWVFAYPPGVLQQPGQAASSPAARVATEPASSPSTASSASESRP